MVTQVTHPSWILYLCGFPRDTMQLNTGDAGDAHMWAQRLCRSHGERTVRPERRRRGGQRTSVAVDATTCAFSPRRLLREVLRPMAMRIDPGVEKLSSKARKGLDILPLCHAMNKSQVARFSAIGTITTFGRRRCEIKLGCNETAPSLAEITSPSSRLFPTPIETKRGRNLPNRRQNRAIFCLYPGATLSGI